MKKLRLLLVLCTSTFVALPFATADASPVVYTISSYLEACLAVSTEIKVQEESVQSAESLLVEARLSDTSEMELAEAELDVLVRRARLAELRFSQILDIFSDYADLLSARKKLDHANTGLSIAAEKEAAARTQTDEGVKNELDYYDEYISFREAEIQLLSAQYAYDDAERRFLRRLSLETKVDFGLADITSPDPEILAFRHDEVLAKAQLVSSSYLQKSGNADIQARRYAVYSELGSTASPKALKDMGLAAEAAKREFTAEGYALSDRAFSLVQQFHLLRATAVLGVEKLKVAKLRWEERKRGFEFGLVTERQLKEYRLSYDRAIEVQNSNRQNLFHHYLRILSFIGEDPRGEVEKLSQ